MAIVHWLSDIIWAVNRADRRVGYDGTVRYCDFTYSNNHDYLFLLYTII